MKKNFANLLLLYRKWKKRDGKLFKKNSSVCIFLYKVKHFLKWRDIRPSMVTHTQNLCSAFNPSKVHTQLWTHTHTQLPPPPPISSDMEFLMSVQARFYGVLHGAKYPQTKAKAIKRFGKLSKVFLQRWAMQPIKDISVDFFNAMANQKR